MLFPFGSSMSLFSNAMALNIVPPIDQDYSQRYERFYKDNSFREDYYNYHKQHHQHEQQQQQQQQQQSNYNEDAYNEYRKVSDNNNGYDNDDNKYSNYPIKEMKYECQAGQFEGFFVSSPEYCELEIPQGRLGPSLIPPETVYTVEGPINSTSNFDVITSIAVCNPGDIAVSGGITIFTDENNGLANVAELTSEPTPNDQEWLTSATGEDITITGSAKCFDNP
jgi:hypothetical protein